MASAESRTETQLESHTAGQPQAQSAGLPNAFTVDLEEWFQGLTSTNRQVARWPALESRVVEATDTLLAILAEHHVRATFFVLGHVADHHAGLIETIQAAGHELAIHGYYHRFVHQLRREEFAREVAESITALERITGETPQGHRAPYFSVNASTPWAFEVLAEHGLRYDSSVFPTRNMLYGFPDAPRLPYRIPETGLWELPASTVAWAGRNWPVAGGFYVRAMPYGVTQRALRRLHRAGEPAIMYVHPWELDVNQCYDEVTLRERVTHYHGRRTLRSKLHRLLSEFRFGPMCELVDALAARAAQTPEQPKRRCPDRNHAGLFD